MTATAPVGAFSFPDPNSPRVGSALACAAVGLRVHPLYHVTADGLCSCGNAAPDHKRGKHPLLAGWKDAASCDERQIRSWWGMHPLANIGIATGLGSGVLVVDLDGPAGLANFRRFGELPQTFTVETSGGSGEHLYFLHPETEGVEIRNSVSKLAEGVDVRTTGGNIVGPGSANERGVYRVKLAVPPAPVPDWLLHRLTAAPAPAPKPEPRPRTRHVYDVSVEERARKYARTMAPSVAGSGGHTAAFTAAQKIARGFDLPADAAFRVLDEWNDRCDPPWSEDDLRRKVVEAVDKGTFPIGSLLNAERPAAGQREATPGPRAPSADEVPKSGQAASGTSLPPRLGTILDASIERAMRRADGREKPIALPWAVLADHFGGGLWPGLHLLTKGTGVGGSALALQVATTAAKDGVPALYIGLELGEHDLATRLLGEEAGVPWSPIFTGKAGPAHIDRVRAAAPALRELPFHFEVARPHGFPPSAIMAAVEAMRAAYPESDGPGSRPLLVVIDFLQLVGDEPNESEEVRQRIGRASYVLRDIANRLGVAVLAISSVAREKYALLNTIQSQAGLAFDEDENGCPVRRRILNTDAIVGTGKESGDLEYSADSVSVIARVASTWDGNGCDMVFATAKGRATGATWSPLHFTGFAYRDCPDRGGRIVEAWRAEGERREEVKAAKHAAKEQAKVDAVQRDADAVRAYVLEHPRCSVNEARQVVGGTYRRWVAAKERLGPSLVESRAGSQKVELTVEEGQP